MENQNIKEKIKRNCRNRNSSNGSCMYFMGIIGAATYFISSSVGFWAGAFGILKALVWPAILVFKFFELAA
jgi:hypothetical protein